jgi:UDP-N-acetylmuramoylalanine--D-glutamate ligase
MDASRLAGLRAAIIGVAREGTALARYLAASGATVTLSDVKPATQLEEALRGLDGLPVRLALGGHPPDLLDVDVLFLSPGVPLTAPLVRQARERGIPISSEPRLFVQMYAGPVVGITGSSGKTTTTTLIGRMLGASGKHVWVGGNIGMPLIGQLAGEESAELAVMELSSFQLELFRIETQGERVEAMRSNASQAIAIGAWSPKIAVVTNITPNHLDRHPSMENYIWAKAAVVDYQRQGDWAVLNRDDENAYGFRGRTAGHIALFSLVEPVDQGAYLIGDVLRLRLAEQDEVLCGRDAIRLRGQHNVANMLAAACAARLAGADIAAIRSVATEFEGVPHRLEVVRRWNSITFVNDSIATTPERAIAALRAFSEPLVVLAGGRDKHLPWDRWAEWVQRKARVAILFGECAPLIRAALAEVNGLTTVLHQCDDLPAAVALARDVARPGEVVLLSPGGTSFDAFTDFEARGLAFRQLVESL